MEIFFSKISPELSKLILDNTPKQAFVHFSGDGLICKMSNLTRANVNLMVEGINRRCGLRVIDNGRPIDIGLWGIKR